MYCKKLSRVVLRVSCLKPTSVSGGPLTPAYRTGFSWTAVCQQRSLWLQRSALMEKEQRAVPCQTSLRSISQTTVDPDELRRFQSLANKWWDEQGEFAALHAMNDLRVPFIRDNLLNVHRGRQTGKPLAGLKILDVGCGGGLLTEPLGRLGASILGIDPVAESIGTAQLHSSYDPDLRHRVSYRACSLEELNSDGPEGAETAAEGAGQFDAVVASEVVEHLADLETFAYCCSLVLKKNKYIIMFPVVPARKPDGHNLLGQWARGVEEIHGLFNTSSYQFKSLSPFNKNPEKPGGSLFITTLNKTNLSWLLGIVVAENVLRIVPAGTHEWEKFISPEDLERLLESNGFSVQSVKGMLYNPVTGAWSWTNSTAINYALHAVKLSDHPPVQADESSPHPEDPTAAHSATTHS